MVYKAQLLYQIGGYNWVWIEDIEVDKEGDKIKVKLWDDEISFDGMIQPLYYGGRKKLCFEAGIFDSEDSERFYYEYMDEMDEIIINKINNYENKS